MTRILAYVSAALFLGCGVLGSLLMLERADHRATIAAHDTELALYTAAVADAHRAASERARTLEAQHTQALAKIGATYEQEKADAQARADAVVADLRAGHLRLHARWQAAIATDRLATEVAARAGEPDAGAEDRAASAGRIVRAAAECDAQVRGLQAIVIEDRRVCGIVVQGRDR